MLTTLAIEGYRSLRHFAVALSPLTVITGANGTGKSSVYRAVRLLSEAARNGAVAALAREGGLSATLWAGPENISSAMRSGEHDVQGTVRKGPVSLRLGFGSDDFGYAMDLGLPVPDGIRTLFGRDPEIKAESVWSGGMLRPSTVLTERRGPLVRMRGTDGEWLTNERRLRGYDSMLGQLADPRTTPELFALRDTMRSWRFYDHFRADSTAPARAAQVGTRTPVLAHDGSDLAAALQTIHELGAPGELDAAIHRAFPGASLEVQERDGYFSISMGQPGLLRPLASAELSDGTLRYLLLVAALLSPRAADLVVLNEPETSLHPDLIQPLAELILSAAQRSQLIVVSHSSALVEALARAGAGRVELIKELGETRVRDQGIVDAPPWAWPKR